MSTTAIPGRFTALPDENTLQATVVALTETGIAGAINDGGGRWESARNKSLSRLLRRRMSGSTSTACR
jgi:hypothetical protein